MLSDHPLLTEMAPLEVLLMVFGFENVHVQLMKAIECHRDESVDLPVRSTLIAFARKNTMGLSVPAKASLAI